jgi:hypothetical protein
MKTPYPQMAQTEQIFNAFSPGAARHIVPTLPGGQCQGVSGGQVCVIREICGWTKTIMRIAVKKRIGNQSIKRYDTVRQPTLQDGLQDQLI